MRRFCSTWLGLLAAGLCCAADWHSAAWRYRKEITIDRSALPPEGVKDFPLLVQITDADLRGAAHGGQVANARGADIMVTSGDGKTRLPTEMERYDARKGEVVLWVKAPALSASSGATLYLYYGNHAAISSSESRRVWSEYKLVTHLSDAQPGAEAVSAGLIGGAMSFSGSGGLTLDNSRALSLANGMTVEAWVHSRSSPAEGIQSVVSKWTPRATMDRFQGYDAGNTGGMITTGFFGAIFDGRYIYFAPQHDGKERHGKVLRYDTRGDFQGRASWSAYDAGRTGGLSTKGYYGGAFDGRYVYFSPRFDNEGPHSRVLRYDTRSNFNAAKSWDAFDAGDPVSHQGAVFDGRYVYFLPGSEGAGKSGKVLRYDTKGNFHARASYATYDASRTSGMDTVDYDGGVFDGRYIYLSPLSTVPLRYDTTREFQDSRSWEAFDAGLMNVKTCVGAVYDGRYVYYVPYGENSVVVRYDTTGSFTDKSSWSGFSYPSVSRKKGYDGGAFDGRYVYFIPFWDPTAPKGDQFHGIVLRYDTLGDFRAASSWSIRDAGNTGNLKTLGFNAGAFDGRFLYFAPWRENIGPGGLSDIVPHGRVLRYDTLGDQGSFSLRSADYGHNGGLGASLPGATFLVNTATGVIGARANRVLPPGWHHLAGVYDGKSVRLYVDGELADEQAGSGAIAVNDVEVAIGKMSGGGAGFVGMIDEVRISGVARSAQWLKTQYRNQRSPSTFLQVRREELAP